MSRRLPSLWFNISASGCRRTNHAASAATRTTNTTQQQKQQTKVTTSIAETATAACDQRLMSVAGATPTDSADHHQPAVRQTTAYNRKLCEVRRRFVCLLGFFFKIFYLSCSFDSIICSHLSAHFHFSTDAGGRRQLSILPSALLVVAAISAASHLLY